MLKFKMEEENRPEFSSPVEPEVEPFQLIDYASVPDTVAPVEQRWEQQEKSNKDNVTELILRRMRRLAISSDKEEGNSHHERDDELRTDEDSQCNLHRALTAIFSATHSKKDGSDEVQEWRLTGVDLEDQ